MDTGNTENDSSHFELNEIFYIPKEKKEEVASTEHYLFKSEIQDIVRDEWPELLDKIQNITIPTQSKNPDELELSEIQKREKRVKILSMLQPLNALQALLYEEMFAVNDNPGEPVKSKDLPAPTPGGLLSHGYVVSMFNSANVESISKLPFEGKTAKQAIDSLGFSDGKIELAECLAQLTYPGSDYLSEHTRRAMGRAMLRDNYSPPEDVDHWSYRLIMMFKKCPDLSKNIEDQDLIDIIMPGAKGKFTLGEFWHRLWSKMSKKILVNSDGQVYFKDPKSDDVMIAIKQMLYVRLHPETQSLFRYISPSGYINEKY